MRNTNMTSKMTPSRLSALAVATVVVLSGSSLLAQEDADYGASYGWSNHYAGVDPSAALYPSPHPTPPHAGHTYITYPPFAPHQYLYTHGHRYVRCNPGDGSGGGRTTTTVRWGHRWYPLRTWNDEFPFFNLNEALPR